MVRLQPHGVDDLRTNGEIIRHFKSVTICHHLNKNKNNKQNNNIY